MASFYEPCTDCEQITGADMRDEEGICWSCQHRYRDEKYARRINTAIDADFKGQDMFWWHMAKVMSLCYKVHDLQEKLKTIPYSPSIPYEKSGCIEIVKDIQYFDEQIQYHLDVSGAIML